MTRELARRIAFTIGALLLFRLGTQIPLPGLGVATASFEAPVMRRVSIFALGLIPYLSAAIVIQLIAVVWRRFGALERSGERGRRRVARFTLVLTLLFAAFQAYGFASAFLAIPALVPEPNDFPVLAAAASLVGGVFVLVWLSEQITRYGIGNGLALVLSVEFLIQLPSDVESVVSILQSGVVSAGLVLAHALIWIVLVAMIVMVESAGRNIPVAFAERRIGERLLPARSALLPIKINNAGYLMPATVAPWILFLPLAFAGFALGADHPLVAAAYQHLQVGQPVHVVLVGIAMFVLVFVYTSYVVDPEHAAESLRRHGGAIPGIAPGEATADHLDRVVSLTTVVGAVYLTVVVQLIPEAFVASGNMLPYNLGGGAALIVVCTILDLRKQVRDHSLTNPGGERQ